LRIDRDADYGPLNTLARNRVNLELVAANWNDILRVFGSLMLGRVAASDLVRVLQAGGRPTTLGRAIAGIGRVPKTVHLLT
jgi:TnpA family transposase